MTGDTGNRADRSVGVDRAMIPLAVIGVLILVSAVLFVAYAETRGEPEPTVDASLAIEGTEANVQTVLRDAAQRAAETAAAQPLTDPNADDEFGAVLNTLDGPYGPDDVHDDRERDANNAFYNYLKALIYLEVEENLAYAGRERNDIETEARVESIETAAEFAAAIERVSLEMEPTNLTVGIENVTVVATHDDEVIAEEKTDVEVTIVTPVMQLHETVQEYQYAIDDAGVTERGFEQRFNARTYAIGWARGWAQNYRAPVSAVLANRHVEPSANAALYRTQQDVFGAADPNLRDATRLGWLCMALQDGKDLFDTYTGGEGSLEYENFEYHERDDDANELVFNDSVSYEVPDDVVESFCRSAQATMDHLIEGPPRAPGLVDLMTSQEFIAEEETLDVGGLASVALGEMGRPGYRYSFENAVDRVYSIEGYTDGGAVVGGPSLSTACKSGSGSPRRSVVDVSVDATQQRGSGELYYRYDTTVGVTVEERRTCRDAEGNVTDRPADRDSYSFGFTTEVGEEEPSPLSTLRNAELNAGADIARKYEPGGPPTPTFSNFVGAEDEVTAALVGSASTASYERWVRSRLDDDTLEYGGSVDFSTTQVVELDHRALLDEVSLAGEMAEDLLELREEAAGIETTFERHEVVTDNPVDDLLAKLEEEIKAEYVETDAYASVGEKALYEARYVYYLTLKDHLEALRETQEMAADRVTGELDGVDGLTADVHGYIREGIRDSDSTPAEFDSPELTGNVSYEVSGTPTYLVSEEVEYDRVPAVGEGRFAPLATRNENFLDLPYEDAVDGLVGWVVDRFPWPTGEPDAEVPFRMAGDVLKGAELALEAQGEQRGAVDDQEFIPDTEGFNTRVRQFEENVEKALEEFQANVSRGLVAGVYPSPGAECVLYDGTVGNDRYPGWGECGGMEPDFERQVERTEATVKRAVEEALAPYDTAETALLIGEGRATAYIAENVTDALEQDTHAYGEFQAFEEGQWEGVVNASAWPAAMAASAVTVELGPAGDAEAIDNATGKALTAAAEAALADRFDDVEAIATTAIEDSIDARWLGDENRVRTRAARMPAGLPLLPVPGKWVATANAWHVYVGGEYARFEVTANLGGTEDATGTTYVRENMTVAHEIGSEERELGSVEPIGFETDTALVVVTTPGVGVGDRDAANPECSPTYPHVGEISDDERDGADGTDDGDDAPGCEVLDPLGSNTE